MYLAQAGMGLCSQSDIQGRPFTQMFHVGCALRKLSVWIEYSRLGIEPLNSLSSFVERTRYHYAIKST